MVAQVLASSLFIQMQRWLQSRMEAQEEYLTKIIEEQQRLSGLPVKVPSAEDFGFYTFKNPKRRSEPKSKTDPATRAPISESLALNRPLRDVPVRPVDEVSYHKPLTPDPACFEISPNGLSHEAPVKKQRK